MGSILVPTSTGGSGGGVAGFTTQNGVAVADNAILRGDLTTGLQGSSVTIADVASNVVAFAPTSGNSLSFAGTVRIVEANTAGVGSPNILVLGESEKVLTNEGTTALNYHTLPSAVAGMTFTFVVQDADGLRAVANAGDTIRVIDSVTAAAGYLSSTTIGSCVTLVAVNDTEWFAVSIKGVWTDGTFTYNDTGLTA